MEYWIRRIRTLLSYRLFKWLLLSIVALLTFVLLFSHVRIETYDIRLFSVAEETIRSPKTIVDVRRTEIEQERAVNEISEVYTYRPEILDNRTSLISSIFDFAMEFNPSGDDAEEPENTVTVTNEMMTDLKEALSEDVSENVTTAIDDSVFEQLLSSSDSELERTKGILVSQLESTMSNPITQSEVSGTKDSLEERLAGLAIQDDLKTASIELGRFAVVENNLFDEEQTEARKDQAREDVEPVQILEGQVIVQEGYLIDRDIYRQLEALGLTTNDDTIAPFAGLILFSLLVFLVLYFQFSSWKIEEEKKQNYLTLVSIIFLLSLGLMKVTELVGELDIAQIQYLYPAAMAAMLIRSMINTRLALVTTILLAACGSIIFNDSITGSINVEIALYFLFSGLAGVLFLSHTKHRTYLLRAGMFVAVANVLVLLSMGLIENAQYSLLDWTLYLIFATVSGILASILTIGLLPLFEAGFGILSTMKLVELSNPNHPLLKRILTEAPGTYHHSVMVANLAESACEAIGANGLLARVGCYYHDIGKTKRPHFFIENQMNIQNPHDRLSPEASRDIIISHALDGAEMLRKWKLPKDFIDIAEQHHGTTLLKYFYYKAKESGNEVREEDYRYPGPKPQTREAAVISVADSVEAAVRSMKDPTSEKIKGLVQSIIQDRLQDGQFNECDLTLKELEIIKTAFCETLNGIFHSRIEYPEFAKKQERKKQA
ncbi:HD family phosphohydrolase [Jeotgalibacillus sp. ET6]|uniref:HD family phosphohydrolase n=1 Tax=Jeotgalibacillus sp. ET6 TaxID=3037260 RepID=UPI002418A60C|nr:HD family phosphohydrolase [Jeotgalibacillus sp. ET6]MDG5470850.1 HD family phosphohydrolase [Jeotgalibacillus sp. ET6]